MDKKTSFQRIRVVSNSSDNIREPYQETAAQQSRQQDLPPRPRHNPPAWENSTGSPFMSTVTNAASRTNFRSPVDAQKPDIPQKSLKNKFGFGKKEPGDGFSDFPLVKVLNFTIKASVYLLVFLLPIFFLPITVSPLEFNKLTLLIILSGIAGVSWIGKMVTQNELQIKRSFLSIPILIFTAAYVLTSIFSVYRQNSIWGFIGGEGLSLSALLFMILLFYVVSNNFSEKKDIFRLVKVFLLSSLVVFVIGTLQMMGVNALSFMKAGGKGFNTVGSVFSLSIYAGSILIFAIALITEKVGDVKLKTIAFITALAALIVVTLINFKLIWGILAIAMALIMVVGILRTSKKKSSIFLLSTIVFIYCLFGFFAKRPFVSIEGLPQLVTPGWKATLGIGGSAIKDNFLFGPGPGNFAYVWNQFKGPLDNLSTIEFNQGVSYLGTLVATTGLVTILAFLFLVIVMGRFAGINVYKTFFGVSAHNESNDGQSRFNTEEAALITPVSLLWFFITLVLIISLPSLTLLFAWWLAFAILDALSTKGEYVKYEGGKSRVSTLAEKMGMKSKAFSEKKAGNADDAGNEEFSRISLVISLMFVGIITGFIAVVYILSQKYIASVYYQKALVQAAEKEPNLEEIGTKLTKSIYYDQNRDQYFSSLSDVYLLLAQKRINEKGQEISDEDRNYIWTAVSQGVQVANSATVVNKANYANYSKVGSIYQSIIGLVDGIDPSQIALENFEKARDLNPNNPVIYNSIARVYLARYDREVIKVAQDNDGRLPEIPQSARDNLARAEDNLNKALAIHPQNIDSRIILTTVYELKGDLKSAIELTKENLTLLNGDNRVALSLGILYYKDKNYDEGIKFLEKVVQKWDNYSDARYILGLNYARENRLNEAKEQFEKIKEHNPDNENVANIINDLNAGRTTFLTTSAPGKVDEVTRQIEEEQKIQAQEQDTILNNENNQPDNVSEPEEENPTP